MRSGHVFMRTTLRDIDFHAGFTVLSALTLLAISHATTTSQLLDLWSETRGTYTHGWLILGISIWWILDISGRFSSKDSHVSCVGVLVYIFLELLWLVATTAAIRAVQFALLPLLALALIWAIDGPIRARILAGPLLFFYLATPIWDVINPLLQATTILFSRAALIISGVPADFNGNQILLKSGTFMILEGCSGLHYFISALGLAVFYAKINKTRRRWSLIFIAVGLAMLANWVRVYVIVLAGYLTGMQHYLVRVSHYGFGWVLFFVAMAFFFMVAARLFPEPDVRDASQKVLNRSILRRGWLLVVVLVLVLIAPAILIWSNHIARNNLPANGFPPLALEGWSAQEEGVAEDWRPTYVGATFERMERMQRAGVVINVYRAGYGVLSQDAKPAGYKNSATLFDPARIEVKSSLMGNGFKEYRMIDKSGSTALVWVSYFSGARWLESAHAAQLMVLFTRLRGNGLNGVLALEISCASNCEYERQLLSKMTKGMQQFLPRI